MDKLRKVINNTGISLLGQAITWTSTLLLTIAYGRYLGDVKFGELFFAISFVMLFGFPLEFGFNQQLTRDVAQETTRASRYLSNTLLIKAVFWLILYTLILFTCWLLGYDTEILVLVAICGFNLLITSIMNAFRSLHYAFEQVVFPTVGNILEKGLSALVGIILLKNGGGVQAMALVLLGGAIINSLWQAFWFFRLTGASFIIDRVLIRELIRSSIPFITYGALMVIYYRIDAVLLSLMTTVAVVGWYGAAYRLFDTLSFLPNLVIGAVMYPVFSKLSVVSEAELKLAIEKSLNFLLFLGFPMSVGLFLVAPQIIELLYNRPEFVNSVPALQGLAPGLVFLSINIVLSTIIVSTGGEKKITIMAAVALVFNLGLNLILIPLYQQVGAAIVTSLTELLLICLSYLFIPKSLFPLGSVRLAAKAIVASFVMALSIWAMGRFHIFNLFLILPVAMLVYFVTATAIGTIPREDLRALFMAIGVKVHLTSESSEGEQRLQKDEKLYPMTDATSNLLFTELYHYSMPRQTNRMAKGTSNARLAPNKRTNFGTLKK
jgi:O-antigen/teichoic acid export membrane protein